MKSPLLFLLYWMMLVSQIVAQGMESQLPTGAASLFTSRDSVVSEARELINMGRLSDAETLLKASLKGDDVEKLRARKESLEIIRRIRIEYSLTEEELLKKVRQSIPDATQAEVVRWAEESKARLREIDGTRFYFRREPQNIFLFSPQARERRAKAGNAPVETRWKWVDHLKAVIDQADRTGNALVLPVRHRIHYTLTVNSNVPSIREGATVHAWLPYPQEYRQQGDVKLISASPAPLVIAPNAEDGNPVSGGAQRTLFFEQKVADPTKPVEFKAEFEYVSHAYYPKLDESAAQPLPANWAGAYLGERLPHLAFTPELRASVASIIGSETNPLVKARKIFRWVSRNVAWNAEDEYCTSPSFAIKGFTVGRGDCGIQSSVFVSMCRIAGIPARWQTGWETKPGLDWGIHDWSEYYVAPWGWLPADVSYGLQPSDDPRVADFYCGHQDSYRMIVNLDWGRELIPAKKSLRSEPADLQRGEVEVDGENLYFDQWTYKMEVQRDPGPNKE